jgi:hypothetical protein
MDLLEKKRKKEIIKFIFLLSIAAFNIHILIISLIIMTIFFILWFNKYRNINISKIIILSIILFFLLNSYWIIPVITSRNSVINNIGENDFEAFAPKGGLFDLAALYGFWNEGYIYAKDFLPGWQILYFMILSLTIIGFLSFYKEDKIGIYIRGLAVIGIAGFILASGVNGPFGEIIRWSFDNTILKGFRDSQKFIVMMVLAYSVLGGLGLNTIKEDIRMNKKSLKSISSAIVIMGLITPFLYSFMFFNGFAGQIMPTDYPSDWYETRNFLNEDNQDYKILFFPWHLYMDFGWVNNKNKRIANPAKFFFGKEVIIGENVEIGKIVREVKTPEHVYINSLLDKRDNIKDFGNLISILNIKYVILAKESDYKKYSYLFEQTDLELVKESKTLYVFKNKNNILNIYQTDDINNIGAEKVGLYNQKINPVLYRMNENASKKYIVFTEPYSEDWRLDEKEPMKVYGVVNAFENNGKEIRFERFFRITLPAYIISILTFIGIILVYFKLKYSTFI